MDSGKSVGITTAKIVVFVIVMAGFIALAFFLKKAVGTSCTQDEQWSPENKKCRPNCASGQTYYPDLDKCLDCPPGYQLSPNGECVQQCKTDQSLCGTECYNSNEATCLNGVLCDNVRYNGNLNTCCPTDTLYKIGPSKYFSKGVPDDTTIKDFVSAIISAKIPDILDVDVNAFGDVLIKAGIVDVASLKITSKDVWGKSTPRLYDEVRSALGLPFCNTCPSSSMCDSVCCPDGTTCVSKPNGGNICCLPQNIHTDPSSGEQVCCSVYSDIQKICCDDGQVLDNNGLCAIPCGDSICTPPKSCVTAQYYDENGKPLPIKKYCVGQSDCFRDFEYDPRRVQDDNTTLSLPVCKHKNDIASDGPFAYCRRADMADYVLTASDTADPTTCGLDDCLGRVRDKGRMKASWDNKTGKCTEEISCMVGAGVSEPCPDKCPSVDPNQCCMDTSGKLTGLICPKDQSCFLDPEGKYSCAVGFKTQFSDRDMRHECVGTSNPLDATYVNRTQCENSLVGPTYYHPACGGSNAWVMRNGVCYRNLPTAVNDIGDNQWCGTPEQLVMSGTYHPSEASGDYRFCTDVYNRTVGSDPKKCDDYRNTVPYGTVFCREHDQGETPNWVQCTDKNGCTTDMCSLRYNFPVGGGPVNVCKLP